MPDDTGRVLLRPMWSARFLIAVLIILAASFWLRPGMKALVHYYAKEPANLRRSLLTFDPSALPTFGKDYDYTLSPIDSAKDIGTEEVMYWSFYKKNKDPNFDRVDLFVTYYNDPRDKVPHTPEVCARQGGAEVKDLTTTVLETPELAPKYSQLTAHLVNLEWSGHNRVILYVFIVEGEIVYTREQVRWVIGMPGHHYTYFTKIEAVVLYPLNTDPTPAIECSKKLLREALPVLIKTYLPEESLLNGR